MFCSNVVSKFAGVQTERQCETVLNNFNKKSNIIFLIQDQMQQRVIKEASGCIMPNLRNLMNDGMLFERAYTCNAICSPSRASLLTGTLPHTHGMVDCTHTVPAYRAEFDDTLDTITQAMRDEGYHISYYGKWHIERSHDLKKFGIDEFETEIHIPNFPVTVKERVTISSPGYQEKMICGVFSEDATHTEEHYIYEKAMADIDKRLDAKRPFCTFISTYAPHDPYCVPEEIYNLYENKELALPHSYTDTMDDKPAIYRRMRDALTSLSDEDFRMAQRCYYSYCTLVDIQIGKLVSYLKEKKLYDDTMIICMSDHGDMMGAHGLMMKSVEAFEEIYRIPLIVKLPYQERAGQVCDFYINTYEIGPTILELTGCRSLHGQHTGTSMVPWITGENKDNHYAFAEFFGQRFAYTQRIIWVDNLKYVFNAFADDELYDLNVDPDEQVNLQSHPDYQEKKIELCSRMWEIIQETNDYTMADAEYFLLRIAPIGPGPKKNRSEFSIYNKSFQ